MGNLCSILLLFTHRLCLSFVLFVDIVLNHPKNRSETSEKCMEILQQHVLCNNKKHLLASMDISFV